MSTHLDAARGTHLQLATPQEVARREAQEIERLESAAMRGMLVPAEPASQGAAAELFEESATAASVPQLDAAAELAAELPSPPAVVHTAADGQSTAAGQQHAEPDVGELPGTAMATATGALQQGRIEGAPSAPCFHAFIHAHAAAGDLRSVCGLSTCSPGIAWSSRVYAASPITSYARVLKQLLCHRQVPPLPLATESAYEVTRLS